MNQDEMIAQQLCERLGGRNNVLALECCMTRLRFETRDSRLVDLSSLKKLKGVKGVVQTGNQFQVIFGPGLAQRIADATRGGAAWALGTQTAVQPRPFSGGELSTKLAGVFVPLLPAIIGAGMITGLCGLLLKTNLITPQTAVLGYGVVDVLGLLGSTIMSFLSILVGMNAAKQWGGPPSIGAVAGAILISPTLSSLNMTSGRGGLLGAMLAGAFMGWLYQQIAKRMPDAINTIITPLLTMLVGGLIVLFAIEPVGYLLSKWTTESTKWLLGFGGPLVSFILAGLFLPLVMMGVHQGLTPIHLELINRTGQTPLLPVLAMAGAGQVGAAFAIYLKTKDQDLKRIIRAALPVGILGVGEPLIYGVTLPLVRPFIGACIGAGFGGAFVAMAHVGAVAIGVSGLVLAFLVNKPVIYLLGLGVGYVAGFIATWLLGFDEARITESKSFTFDA